MNRLCIAVLACSLLNIACTEKAAPPATAADIAKFVGYWEGHMDVSDRYIDQIHESFPEGDLEKLRSSTFLTSHQLLYYLELKDDSTFILINSYEPDELIIGTWTLRNYGQAVWLIVEEADSYYENHKFTVSKDRSTLTASDGDSYENVPVHYYKLGTYWPPELVYESPYEYAESGELSDFVGDWSLSWGLVGATYDNIRGVMSEENVQEFNTELTEEIGEIMLSDDMTYSVINMDDSEVASETGSWELSSDGSKATLNSSSLSVLDVTQTWELRLSEDKTHLIVMDQFGFGIPYMLCTRK